MTALALGCSHTVGVGIDPQDCYVSVLAQQLNCKIKNLGVAGGNADDVLQNLLRELKNTRPEFVIAQWPNPLRRTTWSGNTARRENIHHCSAAFQQLLKASEQNFYQPWIHCIIAANMLCKLADVLCINILIEDVAEQYHQLLTEWNITLYTDRKLPGQSWLMDCAASDNLHHSAECHKQWAERIVGILNELTTR